MVAKFNRQEAQAVLAQLEAYDLAERQWLAFWCRVGDWLLGAAAAIAVLCMLSH